MLIQLFFCLLLNQSIIRIWLLYHTTQVAPPQEMPGGLKQTIQNPNAYQFNENKTYMEMVTC